MKKYMSTIMPVILLLALCALWFKKASNDSGWSEGFGYLVNNALCVFYVAWGMFELRVSRREQGHEYADYGTRELYGACHAATVLSALWFAAPAERPLVLTALGGLFFLGGAVVRIWAVTTLGRFYSHSVRALDDHEVVDTGPYRWLRHRQCWRR